MLLGTIGYLISAITFLVFFGVLLTDKHRGLTKLLLVLATFISAIWSVSMAAYGMTGIGIFYYQVVELVHAISWIMFLLGMLSATYGTRFINIKTISVFIVSVFLLVILSLIYDYSPHGYKAVFPGFHYILSAHLFLSVVGIVLIEQLYRNTLAEQKWVIKYLCLGLGGMYVYNFYMYSDGLLYYRIDHNLWQARGYIDALVVPLIGVSIIRDPLWSPKIFISRRVVFHTTALLATGIYLLVMGFGGYYVKEYGGSWGLVAQALFLFLTGLILSLLLLSQRIRARLKVWVNKHFYPYKYDYREEWLRFIGSLSTTDDASQLYLKTIKSIAQIIDSPGGMLWLREKEDYVCVESWEMPKLAIKEASERSLPMFMEKNEFVISIDEFEKEPEVYNRLGYLKLPDWITNLRPWLIVPLIHMDKLIGFVVLKHLKSHKKHFNWEDSDLLKTAARQAASYIAYNEATSELAIAKQFEEFNKLSTYVIHDIKNLISQLSLITTNAERHKDNPLFMKDAIDTINNSVDKMNGLISRLKSGASQHETTANVDVISLLQELIKDREKSAKKPIPDLACESEHVYVKADKDQLFSIFGHLVQNAQDATTEQGEINIKQILNDKFVLIEVSDDGCGMDETFVNQELFKPFRTTKGDSGMGIGAFESREIVKVLGGDITVESTPDLGTKFTVSLPFIV